MKQVLGDNVFFSSSEDQLLKKFAQFVLTCDPDMIVTPSVDDMFHLSSKIHFLGGNMSKTFDHKSYNNLEEELSLVEKVTRGRVLCCPLSLFNAVTKEGDIHYNWDLQEVAEDFLEIDTEFTDPELDTNTFW